MVNCYICQYNSKVMRELLLSFLVFIALVSNVISQEVSVSNIDKMKSDTIWLNNFQKECNKDTASFIRLIKIDKTLNYLVNDYYLTGELFMTGTFTSLKPEVREGNFSWYYIGGQKKKMFTYENSIRVKLKYWDIDGNEMKPEEALTEKMPEFPKGEKALMEFILKNLKYPLSASANKVQGKVVVKFIVDESGIVRDAEVIKSIHPALDAEALRVVNLMPVWKPGISEGQPVSAFFTMPVVFRLTEAKNENYPVKLSGQSMFLKY